MKAVQRLTIKIKRTDKELFRKTMHMDYIYSTSDVRHYGSRHPEYAFYGVPPCELRLLTNSGIAFELVDRHNKYVINQCID